MFERLGTLPETVAQHAGFLADERVSELAVDMRKHPTDYVGYHECNLAAIHAEKAVRDVLGQDQHLLTTMKEMINARTGIEYELIYKLGFMDGGRVYHDFVTHKLPQSAEGGEQCESTAST